MTEHRGLWESIFCETVEEALVEIGLPRCATVARSIRKWKGKSLILVVYSLIARRSHSRTCKGSIKILLSL